ncbi:MAG: hypothetical protein WCV81_03580 [Microgenomates group bacterium]|jgi:hypothetical protein
MVEDGAKESKSSLKTSVHLVAENKSPWAEAKNVDLFNYEPLVESRPFKEKIGSFFEELKIDLSRGNESYLRTIAMRTAGGAVAGFVLSGVVTFLGQWVTNRSLPLDTNLTITLVSLGACIGGPFTAWVEATHYSAE